MSHLMKCSLYNNMAVDNNSIHPVTGRVSFCWGTSWHYEICNAFFVWYCM